MKTVHFAYTVPRAPSRLRRGFDRALVAAHLPPPYRSGSDRFMSWQYPIRAPHSISYHLLHAFKEKSPVRYYNFYEWTKADLGPDDIFIGQPLPAGGFSGTRPDHDDPLSVTSRAIRDGRGNSRFIIMPYAHDEQLVGWAKDLVGRADGVILIGGEIWEKDWNERSPFRDTLIKRRLRVDMGIDPEQYPVVKKRFNPKGKRKYLYVGHTAWYKNTVELERIAQAIPNFEGTHIGGGEVRGWKNLSFATLTPEHMSALAEEYDIFVNTSSADAQATTILEQMCFGMAIACTPESGYEYESLTKLRMHDTQYNVQALETLQQTDEEELLRRARRNREIASTRHSWNDFCRAVCDFAGI